MKFFFAFTLLTTSFLASAQRFPRIPRVNVGRPCHVLMIDNWHRPVATYNGRVDIFSGQCASPMNQCRNDLRNRGPGRGRNPRHEQQYRCVDENGRW